MRWIFANPGQADRLMELIADISIVYARNQVKHGVAAFQLFESHGGLVCEDWYLKHALPPALRILAAAREAGAPTIFFPKGLARGIERLTAEMCDFVGIDWQVSLEGIRDRLDPDLGIQGNFDPRLLYLPQPQLEQALQPLLKFGRRHERWILNLGHGVLPGTPVENAKFVVDWVKAQDWGRVE